MKIYLVYTGSYSDRRVRGVFTEESKAFEFSKYLADSDTQEWEANEIPKDEKFTWKFIFQKNGDCDNGKIERYGWEEIEEEDGALIVAVDVNTYDRDKAFKVACDRRTEYLAKAFGI